MTHKLNNLNFKWQFNKRGNDYSGNHRFFLIIKIYVTVAIHPIKQCKHTETHLTNLDNLIRFFLPARSLSHLPNLCLFRGLSSMYFGQFYIKYLLDIVTF